MQKQQGHEFESDSITTESSAASPMKGNPKGSIGGRLEGGLRTKGQYKSSMPDRPLVSVVTVCLNSADTIRQCMESIFLQTYANIEYIVVDGESTDGTVELLQENEAAIDYYVSEPDENLYDAINKGISLARGDYVLVLNSDDWYVPDCVESLVAAAQYSTADFVSALACYVNHSGDQRWSMRSIPWDESIRIRMPLRHELMLIPRGVYDAMGGYDSSFEVLADYEFALRLFDAGYVVYEIPRELMFFRVTGISNTALERRIEERAWLLKAQFKFLNEDEVQELANLADLTPAMATDLLRGYPEEYEFQRALREYSVERSRTAKSPIWRGVELPLPPIRQSIPIISIILPIYNAETTLERCLDSILRQTFKAFEVICVDDCGSDSSVGIAKGYEAMDCRVRILQNEVNLGNGRSRNRAIFAARGDYVFHIDPDDTLPSNALHVLYKAARKYDSELVKGSYIKEQGTQNRTTNKIVLNRVSGKVPPIVNTNVFDTPEWLDHTEGHWTFLYRKSLAKRVKYPSDLTMGQDSLFLLSALCQAQSITVLRTVVYHYRGNPNSAMNTFNARKRQDALAWRRRAYRILQDFGFRDKARNILSEYWNEAFFEDMAGNAPETEITSFLRELGSAFCEAEISAADIKSDSRFGRLFRVILSEGVESGATALTSLFSTRAHSARSMLRGPIDGMQDSTDKQDERGFSVATLCSRDFGGAGIGTIRRVEALRDQGMDASVYSLVSTSGKDFVKEIEPSPHLLDPDIDDIWTNVRRSAALPVTRHPGYCARDAFTLPESVVDGAELAMQLGEPDIIHFHWTVGMVDYAGLANEIKDRAVVWTLADMNAFTGGCHYSEGCEGYKENCRECPLLGGDRQVARQTWEIKNEFYKKIPHLQVVCPSRWLAERARESSLLGDKDIHYIPNPFQQGHRQLTNKKVLRIKLGLPLDKKLLLFGAENVENRRKGGHILEKALIILSKMRDTSDLEVVMFGKHAKEFAVESRSVGFIESDSELHDLYCAMDGYLFPSEEDNAPLTVGESLMAGTPVVAFPVGHVPDILEDRKTGYIAKYLDADDFARGIEWILDLPEHKRLRTSIACREQALKFHDPGESVRKHLAVYNQAIEELKNV